MRKHTRYPSLIFYVDITHSAVYVDRNLVERLHSLPEAVVARNLTKPLLKRFVIQEEVARAKVLPHLLIPKSASGK